MSKYGRCVSTGVFVAVGYAVLVWAMGLMNRPSDAALYAGLAVVAAVIAGGPLVVRRIWR